MISLADWGITVIILVHKKVSTVITLILNKIWVVCWWNLTRIRDCTYWNYDSTILEYNSALLAGGENKMSDGIYGINQEVGGEVEP